MEEKKKNPGKIVLTSMGQGRTYDSIPEINGMVPVYLFQEFRYGFRHLGREISPLPTLCDLKTVKFIGSIE
jgi:hypothetical protein